MVGVLVVVMLRGNTVDNGDGEEYRAVVKVGKCLTFLRK